MGELSRHYKTEYGAWAGHPEGNKPDLERCCETLHGRFNPGGYQCTRKRGHGPDGAYCKQHDPEAAKTRREKADAAYKVKHYAEMKKWFGPSFLEALRKIAAGHNDPRTLATEIVEDFDARYRPANQSEDKP
jgi:hypothetical protein